MNKVDKNRHVSNISYTELTHGGYDLFYLLINLSWHRGYDFLFENHCQQC